MVGHHHEFEPLSSSALNPVQSVVGTRKELACANDVSEANPAINEEILVTLRGVMWRIWNE